MLESNLVKFLKSTAVAQTTDRIFPAEQVPQRIELPYITYQRISSSEDYHMESSDKVPRVRMQLNVFGRTFKESAELCDLVHAQLGGLKGAMGDLTVVGSFLSNRFAQTEENLGLSLTVIDYMITYKEE